MPPSLNNTSRLYVHVLLFLSLLGNFSCQKSTLIQDVEVVPTENTEPGSSAHLKSLGQEENLGRWMQWASFISATVLCQDDEAREEVAAFLDLQNTNAVSIDQLIVSTEHTPRFREVFIDQFSSLPPHARFTPKPSHHQPWPPSPLDGRQLNASDLIYALTVENCIQLFFPNGLSSSKADFYYSTAHPLTLADRNYGYKLSCGDIGLGPDDWRSNRVIIHAPLVQRGYQVIITRPYRTTRPSKCTYDEYEDIDFTQFLNQ